MKEFTVEESRRPTAASIVASVDTVEDAEAAIERLQDDIDGIEVWIQVYHQRCVDGLIPRDEYEDWRRRADGAASYKRRAVLKLQRRIEHEKRNQEAHDVAEARKTARSVPPTEDERSVNLAYKQATIEASKYKTELRLATVKREQKVLEHLDALMERNYPALLFDAFDLVCRLMKTYRPELLPEDQTILDTLGATVKAWRQREATE